MIELSATAKDILNRSHNAYIRVQSWLDGDLLDDDVPIIDGSEVVDRGDAVPEYGTLTVPLIHRGKSYAPIADDAPLAANGQQLVIDYGVSLGNGEIEWIPRGRFVIYKSEVQGDTVQVTFKGMLHLIYEARLVSPFQPKGNFTPAFRALLEPALNVIFDPALAAQERSVVASTGNFDDSRLDAMYTLLKAWPAKSRMTEDGDLYIFVPPTTNVAVMSLTDGVGGTVIQAVGSSSRENAYNCAVVRGQNSANVPVQAVAYDFQGAKRYGGPFNAMPVPYYFEFNTLNSLPIAKLIAQILLADIKRQTAKTYEAELVPNPALQIGDVVSLTTDDYTNLLCTIETLSIPYIHDNETPMKLTLREVT